MTSQFTPCWSCQIKMKLDKKWVITISTGEEMKKKTGSSQGIINSNFLAHYAIDYAARQPGPNSHFIMCLLVLSICSQPSWSCDKKNITTLKSWWHYYSFLLPSFLFSCILKFGFFLLYIFDKDTLMVVIWLVEFLWFGSLAAEVYTSKANPIFYFK